MLRGWAPVSKGFADDFGVWWQAKRDTAFDDRKQKLSNDQKRRRRFALPAHSKAGS
jgi:hypothetical protein